MQHKLLTILLSIFIGIGSTYAQGYDDVYSTGPEKVKENKAIQTSSQNYTTAEDNTSYDDNGEQTSQRSYGYDDEPTSYDNNQSNGYNDDYYYATQIRRFYRPSMPFGYFNSFYWDPYWWDWSCNYPSWYLGYNSGYGMYGGYGMGWNNYGYGGFNNYGYGGYGGYGWNNYGYGGYGCNNYGYSAYGWNSYGYGGYGCGWSNYGFGNGYYGSNYGYGFGNSSYTYGPRSSGNSNVNIGNPIRNRTSTLGNVRYSELNAGGVRAINTLPRGNTTSQNNNGTRNINRATQNQLGDVRSNDGKSNATRVEPTDNSNGYQRNTRGRRNVDMQQNQQSNDIENQRLQQQDDQRRQMELQRQENQRRQQFEQNRNQQHIQSEQNAPARIENTTPRNETPSRNFNSSPRMEAPRNNNPSPSMSSPSTGGGRGGRR
jgi:hypothetical protein